jgi:hypothetical protein
VPYSICEILSKRAGLLSRHVEEEEEEEEEEEKGGTVTGRAETRFNGWSRGIYSLFDVCARLSME